MRPSPTLLVALLTAACDDYVPFPGDTDTTTPSDAVAEALALTGDPTAGATAFDDTCAVCHDPAGVEKRAGPALDPLIDATTTDESLVRTILEGTGSMPRQNVTAQECADIVAWLHQEFDG